MTPPSDSPFSDSTLRHWSRREWLYTLGAGGGWLSADWGASAETKGDAELPRIAPFRFDVTPPVGHPLCGGLVVPVQSVADPLEAIGYIITGVGSPMVICAVDWTGLLNEAHIRWREALAEAAGTSPDRVAVQCVHQHDAPFVCLEGDAILEGAEGELDIVDPVFFSECLDRGRAAVAAALKQTKPLTHIASNEAQVERIAANRRVEITVDGKIGRMRGSSCATPELIALPEGLIDPMLKTVAFYSHDEKVVVSHYYACHPMSRYGKGEVSSDFVGLARKRLQAEEPHSTHIYFTGCAGNVAAGKYNDGSVEARVALTERLYTAMHAANEGLMPQPLRELTWASQPLLPEVRLGVTEEEEINSAHRTGQSMPMRIRSAMRAAWVKRVEAQTPIVLSALHLNSVTLLHLPAESFIEYQLRAQDFAPDRFVATAAYGDGGAWYIPVKEAYPLGGYEVSVANCAETVDDLLTDGIQALLSVT